MPTIKILPDVLANKIAAGEVVERPASVVKELMENAVDAGARRIVVRIEGGGRKLISVVDDGTGMEPDDMLLALERHATSKLVSEADLHCITTLGFRGEALPSIAGVSKMDLESRTRDREVGQRVRVEGGIVRRVEEIAMPPGTRVSVHRLFYNTPARLKFLKSSRTEIRHVTELFVRSALPLPNIHFRLVVNNAPTLDFPPGPSCRERLDLLWGRDVASRVLEFSSGSRRPRLFGYLAPPDISRSSPAHLYSYVNGRWVRERTMHRAVLEGFRPFLTRGRYPLALVFLDLDPQEVDVNVHPTKAEVRFRNAGSIFDLIVSSIRDRLVSQHRAVFSPPRVRQRTPRETPKENGPPPPSVSASPAYRAPSRPLGVSEPLAAARRELQARIPSSPHVRVLAQLQNRYVLCELPDGLLIVDQHAAHERIRYERLKRDMASGTVARQMLAVPQPVELTPTGYDRLEGIRNLLRNAGLVIEPFGEGTYLVREAPAVLGSLDAPRLIREILDALEEAPTRETVGRELLEPVLAAMACHSSIRSGRMLDPREMESLLEELMALEGPHHCPHGRPIWKKISFGDLERMFKRR